MKFKYMEWTTGSCYNIDDHMEWCYSRWAGLPTSVNVIKIISLRHAYRPVSLLETPFPGDPRLCQVDRSNHHKR